MKARARWVCARGSEGARRRGSAPRPPRSRRTAGAAGARPGRRRRRRGGPRRLSPAGRPAEERRPAGRAERLVEAVGRHEPGHELLAREQPDEPGRTRAFAVTAVPCAAGSACSGSTRPRAAARSARSGRRRRGSCRSASSNAIRGGSSTRLTSRPSARASLMPWFRSSRRFSMSRVAHHVADEGPLFRPPEGVLDEDRHHPVRDLDQPLFVFSSAVSSSIFS